jgi:hypothetical protein
MPANKDISFGPDFLSGDLPIYDDKEDDNEYKDKLADEKNKLSDEADQEKKDKANNQTDPAFVHLFSMLASQALIFLGAAENPSTGGLTPNPEQARFQIECLGALYKKTEGNRSEEEEGQFKQALNELQMLFVEMNQGPGTPPPPGE